MKFLATVAATFFASVVLAAPSAFPGILEARTKPTTSPSLDELVKQIESSTTGDKGANSVFWTNGIPRASVTLFVVDHKDSGGLESSLSKCTTWDNGISNIDDYQVDSKLTPAEGNKFNINYSAALAKAAKGVAYVITNHGDDPFKPAAGKPSTHWIDDEFPTLQRNKAVTEVYQVTEDPATLKWTHKKIWPGGTELPASKAS
jgi:hypothetical protein